MKVDLSLMWDPLKEELERETKEKKDKKEKKEKREKRETPLAMFFDDRNRFEIGIDEAGRGPLFGRLYIAAVVLPRDFVATGIKDSKLIKSKSKIETLHAHILKNAVATHVHFVEAQTIDKINIRQATLQGMRECALQIMKKLDALDVALDTDYAHKYFLLIDGNDFQPLTQFNETTNELSVVPHETFVGGDGRFVAIAAASILAKVERDKYILEMCRRFPYLAEKYGMHTHMGYGTKQHLDAIRLHGITQFHRQTFGICKTAELMVV